LRERIRREIERKGLAMLRKSCRREIELTEWSLRQLKRLGEGEAQIVAMHRWIRASILARNELDAPKPRSKAVVPEDART